MAQDTGHSNIVVWQTGSLIKSVVQLLLQPETDQHKMAVTDTIFCRFLNRFSVLLVPAVVKSR
jgi:hypothetical protein